MKRLVAIICTILLFLVTITAFSACGKEESGGGNTVIDMFGFERPEHCFGVECLVLPTEPQLETLFGYEGYSGIVSEAAMAESGKLRGGTTGYVVMVFYTSNRQDVAETYLDFTYCCGTQILRNGEGVEVGEAYGLGCLEAYVDMSLSPEERLEVSVASLGGTTGNTFIQGAVVIPISLPEGAVGTLYVDCRINGSDMVNAQRETTEEVQVGADNAKAEADIYNVSVHYLTPSDYNGGDYQDSLMTDEPSFENGAAAYMVLEFAYRATFENDGSGSLNVLTYLPDRGAISVTIEEAPTGKVQEVTQNNETFIYASFSVLPEATANKHVRMILRLLLIGGGEIGMEIYFTGGAGTALKGKTHVCELFEAGASSLTYTINEDHKGYTVTGISNAEATVINIPDALGDRLPVTGIASGLFKGNDKIKEVHLGNGMTEIEEEAFRGCTALETVTLGEGMLSIGKKAFMGCTALSNIRYNAVCAADVTENHNVFYGAEANVQIGRRVKRVPAYLFYDIGIMSLSFAADSVCETVGEYAFADCASLLTAEIPCGTIGKAAFRNCSALTTLTIGEGVTFIEEYAFSRCRALNHIYYDAVSAYCINGTSEFAGIPCASHSIFEEAGADGAGITLEIGAAVQRIPDTMFHGLNFGKTAGPKISAVNFAADGACTAIGAYAFYMQELLVSITFPEELQTIEQYAFTWTGLVTVQLPDSLQKIDEGVFMNCAELTTANVGNGVEIIGKRAFAGCSALATVVFGENVSGVAYEAFWLCESDTLQSVYYEGDIAGWCEIDFYDEDANPLSYGGDLYIDGMPLTEVVVPAGIALVGKNAFYGLRSLTSITLGNDVGRIREGAFRYCRNLTTAVIGPNVTVIEKNAFSGCDSLRSLTIGAKVSEIGVHAFWGCERLTVIHFEGTMDEWRRISKGDGWMDSTNLREISCRDGVIHL